MDTFSLLPLALVFGALHAFDADHLAAVSAFVAKNPSPRRAVGFGLRWAIGHSISLTALTLLIVLLKFQISASWERGLEFCVGLAMLALGIWVLIGLRRRKIHAHIHEHDGFKHLHFHSHARAADHRHAHGATLLGGLHGVAGTAAFLVLIPVSFANNGWLALAFVAAFSVGVTVAMSVYAFGVGKFCDWTLRRSNNFYRIHQLCTGIASCAIGTWWLYNGL